MSLAADLRPVRIASESLSNDVRNLRLCVESHQAAGAEAPESKFWSFAGHQGCTVIVDRRKPTAPPITEDPTHVASSWKIGERSTSINPITGQHNYNTGNLYRTVHWKEDQFGLDGRFTDHLGKAGMWKNEGLNTNATRSKVIADPTQRGTPKERLAWM